QSKTYGTNDPTLTYTQTGLVRGVTVDGVTLNDSLTGALSRSGYGTLAGENVGTYAFTLGSLANANYAIALTPGAIFAITQASLTINADPGQSKVIGSPDPVFTYGATGLVRGTVDGVAINDSAALTGAMGRVPGEITGGYAYTLGTLNAGNNYKLAFAPNQPL